MSADSADVVRIDVTTTRKHAATVLEQATVQLRGTFARLVLALEDRLAADDLELAKIASDQAGLARLGLREAEQLLETFTTQGETENGSTV